MNRRKFMKSAALAPLAASAIRPSFASQLQPDQLPKAGKEPAAVDSGTPIRDRYEVTLKRVLNGDAPRYTSEFVLEDVKATPGRRFTEFSGDVSGRYIGALATASRAYGTNFPELDGLVAKVIALQKPDGYFGSTFHYDHPTDNDLALLWGNGRLLVGLLEYYRLKPSPNVLASCKRLGDFLVRIGPLMLSQQIRGEFGAQHFASSYICWTQQTEGLANLYEITRDEKYRKLTEEIVAVTERRPSDHVHGYLSSLRGAMDLYRITSDAKVLAACEAAWLDITQSQDLLITGGVPEGWSPNNHRTEGCGEADWLRLNLINDAESYFIDPSSPQAQNAGQQKQAMQQDQAKQASDLQARILAIPEQIKAEAGAYKTDQETQFDYFKAVIDAMLKSQELEIGGTIDVIGARTEAQAIKDANGAGAGAVGGGTNGKRAAGNGAGAGKPGAKNSGNSRASKGN